VDVLALVKRAEEFRTIEEVIANPKIRVGVANRTNGFYYSLDHDIANLQVFDDIVEEGEDGRKKIVETAVDRTIRAVLEGEIDCMVANGYEGRKLLKKKGLLKKIDITNLHQRRKVVDMDEVEYLYNLGMVELHTPILLQNYYDTRPAQEELEVTTIGRAIFNRILPDEMRFEQKTLGKKQLQDLVDRSYRRLGGEITPEIVDKIKDLGFRYATVSGTTVAVTDLTIPGERVEILREADAIVDRAERDFRRGLLTEEERYQLTIDTWNKAKDTLQKRIQEALNPFGPIAVMAISGSTKGGFGPITQLAGMRGLMADPSGRIIDLPIRSHFREGLNALEYFISTHGARKGLADTALRTADAGYLTRRLVDVAQDMIINRTDCGTMEALWVRRRDDIAGQALSERIVGRCSARDIHDPDSGELIVARNQMIDEDVADRIQAATKLEEIPVRSPMTCSLIHGCCALCYGRDLGRGELVEIGTAVGIIAAQSIGEPGTQLTLRTFHTGGTANAGGDITSGLPRVEELFEARKKPKGESVVTDIGGVLRLTRRDGIRVATVIHSEVMNEEHKLPAGWALQVADGQDVVAGFILALDEDGDGKIMAGIPGKVYLEDGTIWLRFEKREEADYEIPSNARLLPEIVDGMTLTPGQQLTEGSKNPHRILRVLGEEATMLYLLTEVQKVYRSQGVNIADKHFEIVIRKMLSRVQITKSGDSELLPGELCDRLMLIHMNAGMIANGGEPAAGVPILLGVTKAALTTDSFLSAASFQHTIRVLAGAAIEGKIDRLYGLKENVIIGKLIPAGRGFHTYQDRELVAPAVTLKEMGALGAPEEALFTFGDDDDGDDDGDSDKE
jgi:DNA-directed RNA polymerase subunit beta'